MIAQGNCPNVDSIVGLLVMAIAAKSDQNHGVTEEVMPGYTGEDKDKWEL